MPNIAHFTCVMPILDTPDVNIDGALIEDIKKQNKHTCGFVQTVKYT